MMTSNPTNNPKTAKADEPKIKDLPDSDQPTELTDDELKYIAGGAAGDPIQGIDVPVRKPFQGS